jgi:hypothetical protein
VARFLYFHFITALLRLRDLGAPGWPAQWAHYHQVRSFSTPGPYIRSQMSMALATQFQTPNSDLEVVNSWIQRNGFEGDFKMLQAEADEVSHRIHKGVDQAVEDAEVSGWESGEEQTDDSE